jgi:hypothetical protein
MPQGTRRDGVEMAEGLVHEESIRLDRESASDPDALLHAA